MSKMLVIDDSLEFKEMLSAYFRQLKFEVCLAENGRDGLAKAKTFRPDVILLDIMMPDIGGIEVIRELQADEDLRAVPVLILTGTYFDTHMSALFKQESNCREFLSKNTELGYIEKKVAELLNREK
jgi:CheY-like chemotaxis protein